MCLGNCCKSEQPLTKWQALKHKAVHLFGSLFMEKDEDGTWKVSLARVSFWLAFLPAVVIWCYGRGIMDEGGSRFDISPNHYNTLLMLAGYNFGKKVADTVKSVMAGKQQEKEEVPNQDVV